MLCFLRNIIAQTWFNRISKTPISKNMTETFYFKFVNKSNVATESSHSDSYGATSLVHMPTNSDTII